MTPVEVASLVGEPERVSVNSSGQRKENRRNFLVFYESERNTIEEIEFYDDAIVFYDRIRIFDDYDASFRYLLLADGTPFQSAGGTVVLLNLVLLCYEFPCISNEKQRGYSLNKNQT